MLFAGLSCALWCLASAVESADESEDGISQQAESKQFTGTLRSGKTYELNLIARITGPRKESEAMTPTYSLFEMKLLLNGENVYLHSEAYEDLTNVILPSGIGVSEYGNHTIVNIIGGKSQQGYQARLKIKNHSLFERILYEAGKSPVVTPYQPFIETASQSLLSLKGDDAAGNVIVKGPPILLKAEKNQN